MASCESDGAIIAMSWWSKRETPRTVDIPTILVLVIPLKVRVDDSNDRHTTSLVWYAGLCLQAVSRGRSTCVDLRRPPLPGGAPCSLAHRFRAAEGPYDV